MNLSSPSRHATHAASEMNTDRVRCFGSVTRAKMSPSDTAFTNTPARLWRSNTSEAVRHPDAIERVPYPIVICVATEKMNAALIEAAIVSEASSEGKPRRHPGLALASANHAAAKSVNVDTNSAEMNRTRYFHRSSTREVKVSNLRRPRKLRPRIRTWLRPAWRPVSTSAGRRNLRRCASYQNTPRSFQRNSRGSGPSGASSAAPPDAPPDAPPPRADASKNAEVSAGGGYSVTTRVCACGRPDPSGSKTTATSGWGGGGDAGGGAPPWRLKNAPRRRGVRGRRSSSEDAEAPSSEDARDGVGEGRIDRGASG